MKKKLSGYPRNPQKGMALVVVLMVMMVATLIGVGISTNTTIDLKISSNKKNMINDFYISDGSNQAEVPKIASDTTLGVADITKRSILRNADLLLNGLYGNPRYHSLIIYHYYRSTMKAGYSLGMFNSYYYSTRTDRRQSGVTTSETKIGPKL